MDTASAKPLPIFPVLLVNFIGMLGYSLILPFLVFLVQDFGGNEFIYGLMGSVYPAFQLVGAPLLGRWSDQIGRRRVLMVSQAGTFLAWVLFIIALLSPRLELFSLDSSLTGSFMVTLPLVLLFLARAFDGITGGNVSVANAYLSDISNDSNRKANFGKMASSSSLGFIVGPALAGLLVATPLGELLPVTMAAVLSLTAIVVIWQLLPESRTGLVPAKLRAGDLRKLFQFEQKECYQMDNCPDDTSLWAILKLPNIPLLFLVYFCTFLGFSFFYAGFPVFASTYLEWSPTQLGVFFTFSSLIMVVVQGPVLSYLSARTADANLVLVGSLLICLNFLVLTIGTTSAVYAAVVLLSVGNGLMWPSFLSILSQAGVPWMQGAIQGYANSTGSLASIFGLILGGFLFNLVGATVFLGAAAMMFCIFLLAFRLRGMAQPEGLAAEG